MTQFREGLEASVTGTIADDITARQKFDDAIRAEKEIVDQYDAELQAFKRAGTVKCNEADRQRRNAFRACSAAKKARDTALSNLEYDLRNPRE